jgi:hypothetical protein
MGRILGSRTQKASQSGRLRLSGLSPEAIRFLQCLSLEGVGGSCVRPVKKYSKRLPHRLAPERCCFFEQSVLNVLRQVRRAKNEAPATVGVAGGAGRSNVGEGAFMSHRKFRLTFA